LLVAGISVLALNLRAAITSLPPVFPELAASLHLSGAALAVLAATPVLCFGVFSGAAGPLSRRFGAERVLGAALVALVAGLLLRGALPGAMLFPGTVVAGAAIALMNVLLPSLVKRRRPDQAGLLIGGYLLLLSGGAVVASLIAVPVFRAAGSGAGAVRLTLGMWALPAVAAAVVWLPQLRYRSLPEDGRAGAGGPVLTGPGGGADGGGADGGGADGGGADGGGADGGGADGVLAMARHALAWQVTAFMGLQSLSYYAALSWFPTLLRDRGISAAHAGDLLALMNFGNAVTALLLPMLAHRGADQRRLVVIAMVGTSGGLVGSAFAPVGSAAAWMLLLGLGQGATLGLAIFFTMARAPDPATAASLSAFAQGAGYLVASTGPLLLGFLHAVTGSWTIPVLALLAVAVGQLISGWLAGRARTLPAPVPAPARVGGRVTDSG
jgi:CP family cyanate transporter-like MFS transporter